MIKATKTKRCKTLPNETGVIRGTDVNDSAVRFGEFQGLVMRRRA